MLKNGVPTVRLTVGVTAALLVAAALPMTAALAFDAGKPATIPIAAAADGAQWQADFDAAREKAAGEKKFLLVTYAGNNNVSESDKKLREDIFDQDAFKKSASRQFVLVAVGGPPETAEREIQLMRFMQEHKIDDFGAALIMDGNGTLIAKVGRTAKRPEDFLKQLDELVETWQSVLRLQTDLDKLTGFDRVKPLGRLVEAFEKLDVPTNESNACCKEIISLDPTNKSGLKGQCEFRLAMIDVQELLNAQNLPEAISAIRKAAQIKGLTAKQTEIIKKQREEYEPIVENLERFTVLSFKAQAANGPERAKLLDQLIETHSRLGRFARKAQPAPEIDKWIHEIASLDPSNQTGLKDKYLFRAGISDAWKCYREKRFDDGQTACDHALANPKLTPEQRQEAFSVKGDLYSVQKEYDKALENYKKALDAAPQGAMAGVLKEAIEQQENAPKEVK